MTTGLTVALVLVGVFDAAIFYLIARNVLELQRGFDKNARAKHRLQTTTQELSANHSSAESPQGKYSDGQAQSSGLSPNSQGTYDFKEEGSSATLGPSSSSTPQTSPTPIRSPSITYPSPGAYHPRASRDDGSDATRSPGYPPRTC